MALAFCTFAQPLLADAVLMKNGERYVGDVTDLGTTLRIKNAAHPDGFEVKKSDVKTTYPKPEVMLQNLRDQVEKAKARYEAGKKAADPNPDLKAALDLLFDPELALEDAVQVYPDFKAPFAELQTSIHDLRKLCRDAQVSAKPPADAGPDKPGPKPQPDPKPGDPPAGEPKPPPPLDPNVLLLAPPADAKAADIANAAKVMQARALDHGFVGVTAKVIRRGDLQVVEMSATDGLTVEMRKRLVWYASRTSQKFEVRVGHSLSKAEAEQFPTPSLDDIDQGKAKAPKGMKWYRFGDGQLCLLFDKWVITRKDLARSKVNMDGVVTFDVTNKALAGALHSDMSLRDGNVCAGIYFLSEKGGWGAADTRLVFEGDPGTRTWVETGFTEADWKPAQNMLDHPLPFKLAEVKE